MPADSSGFGGTVVWQRTMTSPLWYGPTHRPASITSSRSCLSWRNPLPFREEGDHPQDSWSLDNYRPHESPSSPSTQFLWTNARILLKLMLVDNDLTWSSDRSQKHEKCEPHHFCYDHVKCVSTHGPHGAYAYMDMLYIRAHIWVYLRMHYTHTLHCSFVLTKESLFFVCMYERARFPAGILAMHDIALLHYAQGGMRYLGQLWPLTECNQAYERLISLHQFMSREHNRQQTRRNAYSVSLIKSCRAVWDRFKPGAHAKSAPSWPAVQPEAEICAVLAISGWVSGPPGVDPMELLRTHQAHARLRFSMISIRLSRWLTSVMLDTSAAAEYLFLPRWQCSP